MGVKQYFSNEVGGHRWQRIPSTERKGRVHTSTITVALMEDIKCNFILNRSEVRRIFTRGTGAGGQHKNVTDSCVVLTHTSGIEVRIDGRNQHQNEREAWIILEQRLRDRYMKDLLNQNDKKRSNQIGGGERGNKRRTYRAKDNLVIDHISNKTAQLKDVLKGKIDLLK